MICSNAILFYTYATVIKKIIIYLEFNSHEVILSSVYSRHDFSALSLTLSQHTTVVFIPVNVGIFLCINVCHSPFEVEVGKEAGVQKVRAWGPGLKTGMVGKSADFVVEAIGTEVGTLGKIF